MTLTPTLTLETQAGPRGRLLVYTTTVSECTRMFEYLKEMAGVGVGVEHYYADRTAEQREDVLRRWLSGEIHVVVATIAFGMGEPRHHPHIASVLPPPPPPPHAHHH